MEYQPKYSLASFSCLKIPPKNPIVSSSKNIDLSIFYKNSKDSICLDKLYLYKLPLPL